MPPITGAAVKDIGADIGRWVGRYFTDSTEATIKDSSPIGPKLVELIKGEYQPEFSRTAMVYEQQHVANLQQHYGAGTLPTLQNTAYGEIAKHRFGKDLHQLNESQLKAVAYQAGTRQARDVVGKATFGASRGRLTAAIQAARAAGGAQGDSEATNLANALSVYMHEGPSNYGTPWREDAGIKEASPYQHPKRGEILINKIMGFALTPLIVIPHAFQNLNDYYNTNLGAMAKGLAEFATDHKALETWVNSTGALEAETRYLIERQANGLDNWAGNLFHQPGFSPLRKQQMIYSAAVHKHNFLSLVGDLVRTGNPSKEAYLNFYGISSKDILDNIGKGLPPVSNDQIANAVYRGVDSSFFINRDLQSPYAWNQNIWTRNIFKYKHWSFAETKFIKDGLVRAFQAEGVWGIGKQLAVLGTIFPLAGEMIKATQHLARGQGIDTQDYQKYNLISPKFLEAHGVPHGATEGLSEYVDAMSHTVGIGIEMSAIRAAQQGNLAHIAAGAVGGNAYDLTAYTVKAFQGNPKGLEKFATGHLGPMGPFIANNFLKESAEEKRAQRIERSRKSRQTRVYNRQHKNKGIIDTLEGK